MLYYQIASLRKKLKSKILILLFITLCSCSKTNYDVLYLNNEENKLLVSKAKEINSNFSKETYLIFNNSNRFMIDFSLYKNEVEPESEINLETQKTKAYEQSSLFTLDRNARYLLFFKDELIHLSVNKLEKYRYIIVEYDYKTERIKIIFSNEFKGFR